MAFDPAAAPPNTRRAPWRSPWAIAFWNRAYKENITGLAGMVAYTLVLAIFPFALLVLFVFGQVVNSPEIEQTVILDIQRIFPNIEQGALEMALAPNVMVDRSGFYCDWTYLKLACLPERCVFTRLLAPGEVLPIPMAHAEGRFVTERAGLLEQLREGDQVVFRYCDGTGAVAQGFPDNPKEHWNG